MIDKTAVVNFVVKWHAYEEWTCVRIFYQYAGNTSVQFLYMLLNNSTFLVFLHCEMCKHTWWTLYIILILIGSFWVILETFCIIMAFVHSYFNVKWGILIIWRRHNFLKYSSDSLLVFDLQGEIIRKSVSRIFMTPCAVQCYGTRDLNNSLLW